MHSFGYLFKEGIKSLWKNRTMSIASIGVLISCLLLTGIASLLSLNISAIMQQVEKSNSITVYLDDKMPTLSSMKLGEQLWNIENIEDYTFIPKDEGLDTVIDMLGENGQLLYGMSGSRNFLPDAYRITIKDLSRFDETIAEVTAIEGVDHVTDFSDTANKLSNLDSVVRYGSIAIVLILAVVSLFIISNTIKVTMFSRRMEISIMKSVGATNGFVRIPFIVEGIIIGMLSGLSSAALLVLVYDKMVEGIYGIVTFLTAVDIAPIIGFLFVAYAVVGMLFGIVAGGISIGKYLKKEGENAVV